MSLWGTGEHKVSLTQPIPHEKGPPGVTYLSVRSASLRRCDIVRAWQPRARLWIRARYLDDDRGISLSIRVVGVPMEVGARIGPLVLSLESATDLQTFDQTGPAFQYIRPAFDLLLFGPVVLCLPVCLFDQ